MDEIKEVATLYGQTLSFKNEEDGFLIGGIAVKNMILSSANEKYTTYRRSPSHITPLKFEHSEESKSDVPIVILTFIDRYGITTVSTSTAKITIDELDSYTPKILLSGLVQSDPMDETQKLPTLSLMPYIEPITPIKKGRRGLGPCVISLCPRIATVKVTYECAEHYSEHTCRYGSGKMTCGIECGREGHIYKLSSGKAVPFCARHYPISLSEFYKLICKEGGIVKSLATSNEIAYARKKLEEVE